MLTVAEWVGRGLGRCNGVDTEVGAGMTGSNKREKVLEWGMYMLGLGWVWGQEVGIHMRRQVGSRLVLGGMGSGRDRCGKWACYWGQVSGVGRR